ncbi:DUF6232 family protein [Actinomycetes bacterium KLBMP 9797]
MTVYYRGPCVLITHQVFRVLHPHPRVYAIRDLSDVYVVEERGPSPVPVTLGSSGLAGVAAVVVATSGLDLPAALALAGGASLLVAGALAGACVRIRAHRYELRARHRGASVLLFATADQRAFGQVRRGLVRALEQGSTER